MQGIRTTTNGQGARGSALVPVLLLLSSVLVMGVAFSQRTLTDQKGARRSLDERKAFYLAESGLHEAYEAVREGHGGSVGSAGLPAFLDGGVFWVTAEDIGGDRRRLTATALAGSGRQALESVIHYTPEKPPLFTSTLNSKETMTLNEGVVIDSYESDLGTYASQAVNTRGAFTYANANGDVRSNGDIVMNANATVFGDVSPGPDHGVSMATGSYVDGAITPSDEPFVFPEIDVPVYSALGNYTVPRASARTLGPGEYDFDTFTIDREATLLVTGPATIVVDDFLGGRLGNLRIDASGGPVTFHVRNTYSHQAGFGADAVDGSPMLLAFMLSGTQDVVFPSTTNIRGAYYAPNADIVFSSGNECWGAFAANRIAMSNDMRFHYDESLLAHWQGDGGAGGDRLTVLAWHRTGVRPTELMSDRRPPLEILRLDASDLPSPGGAWGE